MRNNTITSCKNVHVNVCIAQAHVHTKSRLNFCFTAHVQLGQSLHQHFHVYYILTRCKKNANPCSRFLHIEMVIGTIWFVNWYLCPSTCTRSSRRSKISTSHVKCGNKFLWYHNAICHCLCGSILYVDVGFNLDSCHKRISTQLWLFFICHAPHSSCVFGKNNFPTSMNWIIIEEFMFHHGGENIRLAIYWLEHSKLAIKYPYLSSLNDS